MPKSPKRRRFLQYLATGSLIGIAGCNQEATETATQASPTDASTQPSSTETTEDNRDREPPELSVEASPTENAEELELVLEAQDDSGLQKLVANINGEQAREKNVSEAKRALIDILITDENTAASVQPGIMNSVQGTARDQYDNETEKTVEQYVRKYDVFEKTKINIGTEYWLGQHWEDCMDPSVNVRPSVGKYDMKDDAGAVNRHIDQMLGHGISTMMLGFNGSKKSKGISESILSRTLAPEIDIGLHYPISNVLQWNLDNDYKKVFQDDFAWVREKLYPLDNYETTEGGRPVIAIWNANWLPWGGSEEAATAQDRVLETWGGYPDFIGFFREELTRKGKNPYLIGDTMASLEGGLDRKYRQLDSQFDALTHWPAPDGSESWEKVYDTTKEVMKGGWEFASKENIDFIPRVFPGFDDRHNTCWGDDRQIPRSPNNLSKLLGLAEKFRTTDRVLTIAYNDWTEGTQIEPGTFLGEDYGTDYLEIIKEFQSE